MLFSVARPPPFNNKHSNGIKDKKGGFVLERNMMFYF